MYPKNISAKKPQMVPKYWFPGFGGLFRGQIYNPEKGSPWDFLTNKLGWSESSWPKPDQITLVCVHPGSPFGPNGLPIDRIGNPWSMDHPTILFLVLDSQGLHIAPIFLLSRCPGVPFWAFSKRRKPPRFHVSSTRGRRMVAEKEWVGDAPRGMKRGSVGLLFYKGDLSKIVWFLFTPTWWRFDKIWRKVLYTGLKPTSFLFGKSLTRWWFQIIFYFYPNIFQMGCNHQLL